MKPPLESPPGGEDVDSKAAQWVLRWDRGLTAAEQDEFSSWLARNPQHRSALAEHRWGWDELDRLAGLQTSVGARPDPDLLARRSALVIPFRRWAGWGALGMAAAAMVVAVIWLQPDATRPDAVAGVRPIVPQTNLAAPCERRTLDDGSIVDLNRGAAIEVMFSTTARNIRLVRGEANFVVAKDTTRPFVVDAGGVAVRAIGTVFNVRLEATAVEVLVTEGVVDVAPPTSRAREPALPPTRVATSQRAVVRRAPDVVPDVATLSAQQLGARLAWQPRLLDFTDATLREMVEQFNARNDVQLVVADSALGATRLSATFRSDNVEGFVRLMESDFGMRAEWRGAREIALRRAQ